ncbi:hypothetical protein Avbf_06074 [Armadillidium vulgare]|nr:hypothetical protein Avbf_06074 [Armadillidium vulgare]
MQFLKHVLLQNPIIKLTLVANSVIKLYL